jgi:hypothetical protein
MGGMRNANKILVGKHEVTTWSPRPRCDYNIKMDLESVERGCGQD